MREGVVNERSFKEEKASVMKNRVVKEGDSKRGGRYSGVPLYRHSNAHLEKKSCPFINRN